MKGVTKDKTTARRRGKPIEVWVTDEEKAVITNKAKEAGMSRSGYLRALGLNTPIRSVVDLTAVADLGKANGDLGRVAGLLKLWLAEKRGQGAKPVDVEEIMTKFRILQAQVLDLMSRIVYERK
ncbi:plasmid mobilization protein [Pseudomonas syringae]|uniref:plasmid mobilization protein n=1 Tax=Pseudomonas syringae TaxID=317 RepID=UPI0034D4E02F